MGGKKIEAKEYDEERGSLVMVKSAFMNCPPKHTYANCPRYNEDGCEMQDTEMAVKNEPVWHPRWDQSAVVPFFCHPFFCHDLDWQKMGGRKTMGSGISMRRIVCRGGEDKMFCGDS